MTMEERNFHKIKGTTPDERFANLEVMLRRMSRRMVGEAKAVIPPIPVFGFVEQPVNGVLTRCLIPAVGKITRVCLAVLDYPTTNPVRFQLVVESGSTTTRLDFSTKKRIEVLDVDYDVKPGDFITLRVADDDEVKNVWTAMLYSVEVKRGQVMSVLIDELEIFGGSGDEGV